jgi:hypothetical protein
VSGVLAADGAGVVPGELKGRCCMASARSFGLPDPLLLLRSPQDDTFCIVVPGEAELKLCSYYYVFSSRFRICSLISRTRFISG